MILCCLIGHRWILVAGHRMPFAPLTMWHRCNRCGRDQ